MSEQDVNDQQQQQQAADGGEGADDSAGETDQIQNLKGEFSRKLENQNKSLADLNSKLEAILSATQQRQQQQQEEQVDLRSVLLDDPDRAAAIIEQRALKKATQAVSEQNAKQVATQNAVLEMQARYREFSQEGSEAGRVAIEKAARLPAHLKGTPEGVKLAMMEAVAELGLSPITAAQQRRQSSGSDGDVPAPRGGGSQRPQRTDATKDIDKKTLDFAILMDPSIASDPKRLEGLKNAVQRKKWNTYG